MDELSVRHSIRLDQTAGEAFLIWITRARGGAAAKAI